MDNPRIVLEGDFSGALHAAGGTLAVSAYHAGKVLLLDVDEQERVRLTPVAYRKPMGIAVDGARLAIATLDEIHLYTDTPELAARIASPGRIFEHAFFPRATLHCGALDLHDLALAGETVWGVNTRFSCIASFDAGCSFIPRWQPPFLSALVPEDRCHLNGMALLGGVPRFATALGASDSPGGWREGITRGGVLLSVPDGAVVAAGLAMPHSPRLLGEALYLLESARGALLRVDPASGARTTITELGGLVRGLALAGDLAFVGISKVRESSPTAPQLDPAVKADAAAIHAIDLGSGRVRGSLRFLDVIEEIYDLQLLAGMRGVALLGLYDERHRQAVALPRQAFWRNEPPATG